MVSCYAIVVDFLWPGYLPPEKHWLQAHLPAWADPLFYEEELTAPAFLTHGRTHMVLDWTRISLLLMCSSITAVAVLRFVWCLLKKAAQGLRTLHRFCRRKLFPASTRWTYVAESMLANSQIMKGATTPKCQVAIALSLEHDTTVVGSGCRVDDWLLVPTHVLTPYMRPVMVKNDKTHVCSTEWIEVAPDISAQRVDPAVWSSLGVGKAKLAPLNAATSVQIVCPDGRFSVALVERAAVFGRLTYHGSTVGGFSGCLYSSGSSIIGMHCFGGGENRPGGGYEILYLYTKLKVATREVGIVLESDGESFFKGFDFKAAQAEDTGLGAVVLRAPTGRYYLADDEVLAKIAETKGKTDWAAMMEYDEYLDMAADRNIEYETAYQGESPRPREKALSQVAQLSSQRSPVSSSSAAFPPQLDSVTLDSILKVLNNCNARLGRLDSQMSSKKRSVNTAQPMSPPRANSTLSLPSTCDETTCRAQQ